VIPLADAGVSDKKRARTPRTHQEISVFKARSAFIAALVFCAVAVFTVSSSADATTDTYDFNGFFAPVYNYTDAEGNLAINVVHAPAAIPVKFSLGGYRGLDVFADNFPRAQDITSDCDQGPVVEMDPELADPNLYPATDNPGGNSLSYDATTDTYTYVWKTSRQPYANRCWQLILKFNDAVATKAHANFRFE
jgi:hypothetical protein